jgi:tetratricopeptide (TPR) repeat protein
LAASCLAALALVQIDTKHLVPAAEALAARLPADEESLEGEAAFEAATIHGVLGDLHLSCDNKKSAVAEYHSAVRLNPSLQEGRWSEFARLKATLGDASYLNAIAHYNEGCERNNHGDYDTAKEAYQCAIDACPEFPWGYNDMAWLMATCAAPEHRDGETAVKLADRASELTGHRYHGVLDTLAAADAEVGKFARAAEIQEVTVRVAPDDALDEYQYNLERYQSGRSWSQYDRTSSDDSSGVLNEAESDDMVEGK